jgi:hypothetical protein
MSGNCKFCRKQPSMIIRGDHLCSRCNAAGIRSPRISGRSRTSARRAIALVSIWRTTLGSG